MHARWAVAEVLAGIANKDNWPAIMEGVLAACLNQDRMGASLHSLFRPSFFLLLVQPLFVTHPRSVLSLFPLEQTGVWVSGSDMLEVAR